MRQLRTLLTVLCVIGLGVPLGAQTSINFVTPRLGTATLTSAIASITDACTATSCVQLGEAGYTSVSVQTVGTCGTCTLNFEASNDGVVWVAVNLMPVAGTTAVSSTSTAGIWQGGVSAQQFRVRQSARSSGGFVVTARATLGTASVAGSNGGSPGGASGTIQYNNAGAFGGITFTDDNVLVGSGAAWQLKPLTDCAGATQAVTYATAGNTFGCNTISGTVPAGSGSELQARLNGTTLQAVTGSGFVSNTLALGADNLLTVRQVAETPDAVVSIYDNGSGKTNGVEIFRTDETTAAVLAHGQIQQLSTSAVLTLQDRAYNSVINGYGSFFIQSNSDGSAAVGADDIDGNYYPAMYLVIPQAVGSGVYSHPLLDAGVSFVPGFYTEDPHLAITEPLDAPSASLITQAGTPGAATVTYQLVGNTPLGYHTAAGPASTTTTANATLDGTNYNLIASPALAGVVSYDIYRTAGGPSQGKLTGSPFAVASFPVHDTGLAGDASTPTAVNTTGHIYAGAIFDATLGVGDASNYILKWDTDALGVFANDGTTYVDIRAANFIMSNSSIRGDKTDAHAWTLEAWDVDGAVSRAFMTCTNGNTPLCALATPSGGSLTGDFATLAVATVPVATTTGSQTLTNKTLIAPVITQVPVAVGSLPSCGAGTANQTAIVNDALAPALGGAVANGGLLTVGVICKSGTGWLVY